MDVHFLFMSGDPNLQVAGMEWIMDQLEINQAEESQLRERELAAQQALCKKELAAQQANQ